MPQQILNIFDTIQLKEGKSHCPACGQRCVAYAKTLDERLVNIALTFLKFCFDNNRKYFRFDEVLMKDGMKKDEAKKAAKDILDAQKLHYWNIIERTEKPTFWKITDRGFSWLMGNGTLPQRIWVFNNERLTGDEWERDVKKVGVDEVSKRWQVERAHYTLDFRQKGYKVEIKQSELLPANP